MVLVRAGRGLLSRLDFAEEPDKDDAAEASQGDIAEDIHERPQHGLVAKLPVKLRHTGASRIALMGLMAKVVRQATHALLQPVARPGNGTGQVMLVEISAAGEQRLRQ